MKTKNLRKKDIPRNGATFADCVRFFAKQNDDRARLLIDIARGRYHCDGEVEIDDDTVASGSSGDGYYILSWVWAEDDGNDQDYA